MVYLTVENMTKHVPEKVLFEDISFSMTRGDKIGLIADNGTGKSTLLKIIAGKAFADEGAIYINEDIRVGYLEQDPDFDHNLTIADLINSAHSELSAVIAAYEKAVELQAEHYTEETQARFEETSAAMDRTNAWDYERRLKALLSRFALTDLDQVIGTLSGGQKKRLAMAITLLDDPDLLILDEPTNHLDIETIEWLEQYLARSTVSILMVTHDRYFLDSVCNHIIEMEGGKLYNHKGNYADFLVKREERETIFKSEVDKAGKLFKKELEWMRRSPKARTSKAKSRINKFYEIGDKAGTKTSKDALKLEVKMSRIGGKILEMKNVKKRFGDSIILDGFTHTFKKGERIGIIGKNGTGKTTFLNLILGFVPKDSGKINVGDTTVFGYYSQSGLTLKSDKRIIDVIRDIAEVITLGDGRKLSASQFLNHFMFPPKMQRTFYSRLSGGEKRRLYLLTVLVQNPNFLILDEPTNDLDLLTLNKLEEFLEHYKGCLILVTHDRYFMDKLVDQLFVFEGDGHIHGFIGTYSEYRESLNQKKRSEKVVHATHIPAEKNESSTKGKRKLSYHENKEYQALEGEIAVLEEEKSSLEIQLGDQGLDYDLIKTLSEKLGVIMKEIEHKMNRWIELDDIKN